MNTQISKERQDRAVAHTRQIWDRRAPRYDDGAWLERKILKDTRQRLCAQASGRVLDVAVGTGRNLAHYSADVTEVVGIDLSPGMLSQARTAASRASFPVELHEGDARHLPFSEADFDTVVCFLALCEIPRGRPPHSTKCAASSAPAADCSSSTTSNTRAHRCAGSNRCEPDGAAPHPAAAP